LTPTRTVAWLILPAVALLLLAAHLLHNGAQALAGVPLVMIALLGLRRWWAGRLVQATLFVATIEWGLTAAALAQARASQGEPWLRLVLILGAVTLLTALAALAFQNSSLRTWFRPGRGAPVGP
jgi:uncharacterized membrane protein